jgi:glycosyltransferase involved in cell wall biosynthesis
MKSPAEISSAAAPTVSVIIPAYNAAEYIGEALKSVLNQTFQSHEIIIINDGSPDTDELERELQMHRASIRYLKQENRGAAAARNTGLREATGEFIAFLDADDTWLPTFLEDQLELLKGSRAQIVYSDAVLVGDSHMARRTFMELQPSTGSVTPESLLDGTVTVLTSTVLASRKLVFDAGLFDESIKRGHDFDLWLRMARIGAQFAYQSKVLAHHRILENSLSGDTISQLERTLAVLRKIESKGQLTASEKAAFNSTLNRTLAQLAIEKGKEKLLVKDFNGAARSFEEARRLKDSWKLKASCMALRIAPSVLWRLYQRRV